MIIKTSNDWWRGFDLQYKGIAKIVWAYNRERSEEFITAARHKNHDSLIGIMQTAWGNAPDSPHIHEIEGWGMMCDLLSESYVFEDEQNQ